MIDHVQTVEKEEWQNDLINYGRYTKENVPGRKTGKLKDILIQLYTSNPTPNLQEKLDNPRKRAKI